MRVLKVPSYAAVGLLEKLWHLTAREAPAGNVGRLSDDDIADWLGWEQSSALLIDGLVEAGWLDRYEDPGVRLYIHDWHEHSDDTVDNHLARAVARYANGALPRMTRLTKQERENLTAQFAHPSSPVRTEAHEKPLPEPEPEPVPEPDENAKACPPELRAAAPPKVQVSDEPTEADLDRLYAAYPRKVRPGKAREAARRAVKHLRSGKDLPAMSTGDALVLLHEKITRFARSPAGNAGDFTPHMASWLNDMGYLDDEREWQHGGNSGDSRAGGKPTVSDRALDGLRRAVQATTGEGPDLAGGIGQRAAGADGRARAAVVLEGAR